ncbi:MAG: DUF4091 domain-containing protein [Sedimentisphaerales bacterium]|nr:DUF4091 domain-containing protein [Sedimentisphaerales bacterium]
MNRIRVTGRMAVVVVLAVSLCALAADSAWNDATGILIQKTEPKNLLANPGFEEGTDSPKGWTLTGGEGTWETSTLEGKRCVSVTGTGQDNPFWRQDASFLEPGKAYRLRFHARTTGNGGNMISGLDYINRDFSPTGKWQEYSFVLTPRKNPAGGYLRLGQWHRNDTTLFDRVALTEVVPVHATHGEITLGAGESIRNGIYAFDPPFHDEGGNYSRPLEEFTCGFNTNRWTFGPDQYLLYKQRVGDALLTTATIKVHIGYYTSGVCIVECGKDGKTWQRVGAIEGLDSKEFEVPAALLPAAELFVRLRASGSTDKKNNSQPGSFQVYGYTFRAGLNNIPADRQGSTHFLDVLRSSEKIDVEVLSLGDLRPGSDTNVSLRILNNDSQPIYLRAWIRNNPLDISPGEFSGPPWTLDAIEPGKSRPFSLSYSFEKSFLYEMTIGLQDQHRTPLYEVRTQYRIPPLYDGTYGYYGDKTKDMSWWWCEGTYKVSRERPAPLAVAERERQPVTLSACRGEYEPVQVVLRPNKPIRRLTANVTGKNASLALATKVYPVAYHYVNRATDSAGCEGWWPDALPPLDSPIRLEGGQNQPLWILTKVPADCPAGDHTLTLTVEAEGIPPIRIPITVHVYDFTMPYPGHVETAFGLSPDIIKRYHNLESEADQRHVWDLYMQDFREHRISPYNFAPWDPFRVQWSGLTWEGGQIVDFNPASGSKCLRVEDASPSAAVNSSLTRFIPIEKGRSYRLRFQARTASPGQEYWVSLNTYDANHRWISGRNINFPLTGNGQWREEEMRFVPSDHSENAAYMRLSLWAARWSEAGEATGITWFDTLSLQSEGSDTEWISNGSFEESEVLTAELDFSAWDRQAEQYLDAYGFTGFLLRLEGTGGGTFHSRSPGRIGPFEQGSPGYRTAFAGYCGAIQRHLQDKGWLGKEYVYWFDEPEPKDYPFVIDGMNEIKRAGPKLRRMLTEEPIEELFGSVDIWCPILDNYNPDICQARQNEGETIWWYVCTGPKAPYPGLFIDHNAIDLRIWLWMTWKWNVQGILVWESNYWTSNAAFPPPAIQNPWDDPMGYVSGYSYQAGFVGYWGNGDGRFLYPPNRNIEKDRQKYLTGPVSSIRWEMLREGLEDFEYFQLLSEAIDKAKKEGADAETVAQAERLLSIPAAIIVDKSQFTQDPQTLYAHRKRLAEAIEKLNR